MDSETPRGRQGRNKDLGRGAWSKTKVNKRQRNTDEQEVKRRRIDRGDAPLPVYATEFAKEDIAAEERKPKKKVAVMIGYAGTGYKGMQLAHDQKTIEGDLFKAFVEAGAISKANADDPKKSSFVRCARTDKGVHAAGNVISLKLIAEEDDIVQKINDKLVPQIRVWGIERTNNSFSAYQLVDSRFYEYLIPTYSFLPPHPNSYLGQQCETIAKQENDLDNWCGRQSEVAGFWETTKTTYLDPVIISYDDPEVRRALECAANYEDMPQDVKRTTDRQSNGTSETSAEGTSQELEKPLTESSGDDDRKQRETTIAEGGKRIREAFIKAKRDYRIDEARLDRVRLCFALFEGTQNYHNYTVDKSWRDPSAKRLIKSFRVNSKSILIDGTEWLSLKVHGQSFMMHQIRKMVGMVAMVVRCGCDPMRILDSYGSDRFSIPKAPSVGLLLERPVFDTYNQKAAPQFERETIDFDKYKKEMEDFKHKEIYRRIYEEERKDDPFANFFHQLDTLKSGVFLFVTSGGIAATKRIREGGDRAAITVQKALDEADNSDTDEETRPDALGNEG